MNRSTDTADKKNARIITKQLTGKRAHQTPAGTTAHVYFSVLVIYFNLYLYMTFKWPILHVY